MSDYLTKSVTNDGMFRAYAITATDTVQEAQKKDIRHGQLLQPH